MNGIDDQNDVVVEEPNRSNKKIPVRILSSYTLSDVGLPCKTGSIDMLIF